MMPGDQHIDPPGEYAAEFEAWFATLTDEQRAQWNHAMGTHEKPDWPAGWYDTWPEGMRAAWDRLYGSPYMVEMPAPDLKSRPSFKATDYR